MKRVLIIDDEPDIREVLKEFCRILGFEAVIADSGEKGLKLFRKDDFNLIISDLKMPDINGFEFVKKVREKDKNIPIVICSGFIDDKNKEEILNCGADFYLEKPFKMKELKKIFEKISLD